ncbi:hypothetical protein KPL78_26695 [Roseomonas sp. HJA6]|uniref:Uncharacterized protein n=1 Tax=Roseomonas alba TaxID=2846776 RepID=A0ABS7AH19_9PROT|nr:hypothetical protein [Neoroseomonas alba]MBW6401468.1 hypothetical protein [Neoroseomonas alba]
MPRHGAWLWGAVVLAWTASGHAQAPCSDIRFPRGATGTTITGIASPEDVLCYSLATGAGQTARLRVTAGRNIIIGVDGVADGRDDLTFTTERRSYRVRVSQLFRSLSSERFTIAISVR